jgi:hypothetical protein
VISRQGVLVTASADQAARDLLLAKSSSVSSGLVENQMDEELGYRTAFIVRDPDGHDVEIELLRVSGERDFK